MAISITNDLTDEPTNESFEVSLFNPQNVLLGRDDTLEVTITDNDAKPEVSFSQAHYEVAEDEDELVVELLLTNPSSVQVRVTAATVDDTAIAGQDYEAVWNRIRIDAGTISDTVTIPLMTDDLEEGNETFEIILGDPDDANLGSIRRATVTIVDGDTIAPPPTFDIYMPFMKRR